VIAAYLGTEASALALEFNEKVARIAGSKTLERFLQSIVAQIKAMRLQRNYAPMHLPQSCDDHVKILNALSARTGTWPRKRCADIFAILLKKSVVRPVRRRDPRCEARARWLHDCCRDY
jgi:DNA-binding GntR family transcriptional regulator